VAIEEGDLPLADGRCIRLLYGGEGSTLEVSGSDTTVPMERETPFKNNLEGKGVMMQNQFDEEILKKVLKEALAETLQEQRELLHEVFAEVLEDVALAEAIREGRQTEKVDRDAIFKLF
jgi:hypothetical protein